jgi:hypothetical protein
MSRYPHLKSARRINQEGNVMKRMLTLLAMAAGMTAVGGSAFGQAPYGRDDRYGYGDRPGYGDYDRRNGGWQRSGSPVDTVIRDLDRVNSRSRFVDSHDRKHLDKAREELFKFQDRWTSGKFDTGKLDKAVENLEHLMRADQIHPRDRQLLAEDMRMLRDFRSGRGSYRGGPYGYR